MNHYFTNDQKLKSNINSIKIEIIGKTYYLYTDNGVFSKKGLDYGTRILIESLPFDKMYGKVLDVGCGYGPIGLVVKGMTNCHVDMVDVNLRALHLTEMSSTKNKLEVNIYESDAYSNVKDKYDFIITNPPIRAGKKKVHEILIGACEFLNSEGQLWFVMRKDQGLKSTLKDIEKYYNLEVKNKKNGFVVIRAIKHEKNIDND